MNILGGDHRMKVINTVLAVILLVLLGFLGWKTLSPANPTSQVRSLQTLDSEKVFLPLVRYTLPSPPLFSTSYYMLTVNSATLLDMGCKIGQVDRDMPGSRSTVVILDFGSPKKVGSEYGTDLFWLGPVSISQISAAVKNFGQGYYTCVGDDRYSQVIVGVGTTNYHTSISNTTDFYNHGVAWARMVNDLNAWLTTQGYSSQVLVVGANDVELAWNTPAITKAWANGYNSVYKYDWYDYGSLDGCATNSNPNSTICGNGWTREDAWYVTYGTKPVWPLPLIYATSGVNAQQWALLSLYSYNTRGYSFIFIGPMTQKQACDQSPGQCVGLDNTPEQGWNQLYNELHRYKTTVFTPPWSTDIKWWNGIVTMQATPQSGSGGETEPGPSLYQLIAQSLQEDLSSPQLSDEGRANLQSKLESAMRVIEGQAAVAANPAAKALNALPIAPKVLDPGFQTGIFDGPGGVFHAWEGDFLNHWQGMVDNRFVFISAGASADDPAQGILAVTSISADRLDVQKSIYLPPAGTGGLEVAKVEGQSVFLESKNGQNLVFDSLTRQFK
jgi:hypothetical protein